MKLIYAIEIYNLINKTNFSIIVKKFIRNDKLKSFKIKINSIKHCGKFFYFDSLHKLFDFELILV